MKHDNLRAAGHNIADSISSEYSRFIGYQEFDLWKCVRDQVDKSVVFDALRGQVLRGNVSSPLKERLRQISHFTTEVLIGQRCKPEEVTELNIEFRHSVHDLPHFKKVLVTVAQTTGRRSTDCYIGDPLRRPVVLDTLGRRRRRTSPIA